MDFTNINGTEEKREEFVKDDMLHFSNDNASRLLVEPLVVPLRVQLDEKVGDAIVFTHPHLVHDGEAEKLVDTAVTRFEAE